MNFYRQLFGLVLGRRLPKTRGSIQVDGIFRPLKIRRDSYGVPYIHALNERDAWYGLGFCHGQDRSFQLETLIRVVRGTLAEVFGRELLPVDRLSRRIGFLRAALGHLELMPDAQRDILRAYVRGLNAGATHGCPRRDHGFVLLRSRPTPWREEDVLAYMNYMGMHLSAWTSKLTRLYVLQHDGPEALKALDSEYPEWLLVTDPVKGVAGKSLDRLIRDAGRLASFLGEGASNSWALAASRTASGRPILANDPHLAPRIPPPWYLAHLQYPGFAVCGASFAGMPLIPSGFNGTAAWGVTAGLVDNIDLFVEQLDPEKGTVRSASGEEACTLIREIYRLRGEDEPFEEDIRITPRGPVVSDLMPGVEATLSMKATWMTPRPVDGITAFHHATSFETSRKNFKHIYLVSMNVAYADTSGAIGWQLIGEAPRRKSSWGSVPAPGWDPACEWEQEAISLDEMPWLVDPEQGYLASANNQPRREGEGPYLGRDWIPYRHARIMEMLDKRYDWDLERTRRLQLDRFVTPWREMREAVLGTPVQGDMAGWAQDRLSKWHGVASADSVAAALYEFFLIAMAHRLAEVKAPASVGRVLGQGFSEMFPGSMFFYRHVSLISRLLRDQPEGWLPEGWHAAVEAALSRACDELGSRLGPARSAWRWGEVHRLVLSHPLGARKPLDRIYNRGPFPLGGDHDTVAQAGRSVSEFGSNVLGMANLRMAVEVGDWEKNYFVLAGGQSGNPMSPNYDDQLALWLEGKTIRIAWSEKAIQARTKTVLDLVPAPEQAEPAE